MEKTNRKNKQWLRSIVRVTAVLVLLAVFSIPAVAEDQPQKSGKHLFVFIGQHGNTVLDPKEIFTPTLNDAFGEDNVIVVALDKDIESLHAWREIMENAQGSTPDETGQVYSEFHTEIWKAIRRKHIASATLVLMAGEGDAKKGLADSYEETLRETIWRFKWGKGLRRDDLNVVIARIPEANSKDDYRTKIREAQVKVANERVRSGWVNCDDISTQEDGHAELKKRLAEKAISLIKDAPKGKHLFLLSGQSNMLLLRPKNNFAQEVGGNLGATKLIVVAKGGQPMRRWYKKWKPLGGEAPEDTGDLYDLLITSMKKEAEDPKSYDTVTFVWMQGESDTYKGASEVYLESLKGLVAQLKQDLGRDDVNVVIGRINSYVEVASQNNVKAKCWQMVREAQVQAVQEIPRAVWVDTDDLCDKHSGAHMTEAGYKILGKRFAEEALKMIKAKK